MNYYYAIILIAVTLEAIGTSLLKVANGFTHIWMFLSTCALYATSCYLLSIALKKVNLAIADTIWQGTSIILICLASYFVFHEPLTKTQFIWMAVTMIGVIGIGLSA